MSRRSSTSLIGWGLLALLAPALPTATAAPPPGCSEPLFIDSFEDSAVPVNDFTAFSKWNVLEGSVDLLAGGDGFFVDGDGSSLEPGLLMTKAPLTLGEGGYYIEAVVAGSQRSTSPLDSVVLTYDGVYSRTITVPFAAPFDPMGDVFYVPPGGTSGRISLQFSGSDGHGAWVDSVLVCQVSGPAIPTPEMPTFALAAAGLGVAAFVGLRRRAA